MGHWDKRKREDLRHADGTPIEMVWDSMTLMDKMVRTLVAEKFELKPAGIALGENPYGNTALIIWAVHNGYGIEVNVMNEKKIICFNAGPLDADEPKYDTEIFNIDKDTNELVNANRFFMKIIKEAEDMGYGV